VREWGCGEAIFGTIFRSGFGRNIDGLVAEWLGRALQKLLQQFESARDLPNKEKPPKGGFSFDVMKASLLAASGTVK
jgi:hypothetical protein